MIVKGIIKYLIILIGVVVAIGIITVGAMYFFPSINLFGYQFYHGSLLQYDVSAYDQSSDSVGNDKIKVDGSIVGDLDVLILKSNGFDVSVSVSEYDRIDLAPYFSYSFTKNMKGFKKVEDSEPQVVVTTERKILVEGEGESNILQIEVVEPSGVFIRQNTSLKLQIRRDLINFKRLIVESNTGEVSFSSNVNNVEFTVNRADFKCLRGKVNISNLSFTALDDNHYGQINIEKNFGTFNMNQDITANVNIKCSEGNFYFKNINGSDSTVNVIGENGLISFGDIGGNADVRMHYGLFKANTISGEFSALSNPETKDKNDCDYKIGKVLKTVLINNDSGNISIGQTSNVIDNSSFSQIEIYSNSGNVEIENCFSKNVKIENGRGKITLNNCLGELDLSTTYGAVNVKFLTNQDSVNGVTADKIITAVDNLADKVLKIETGRGNSGDGSIKVENIASRSIIKSNGSGIITAEFDAIVGENSIESNRGRVEVVTPAQKAYLLKWLAKNKADVEVYTVITEKVDSFQYDSNLNIGNGWIIIEGATATTEEKLSVVSGNSSLKIVDSNRAKQN